MSRCLFIAFCVIMCHTLPATARSLVDMQTDSLIANHHIITIGDATKLSTQQYTDSMHNLVMNFYYDQFRHFQDPAAPYFLFMSKDATLAMGIGGCVRMRAYYDWGGAIPASGFAPYLIPMSPDPADMRKFGTTPAGSTLFFKVIGRNKKLGNYQLYIEANFDGYQSRDFHLKKAYALVNDWTIGYANSTFSDPAALPPTVDAQGPANKISPTNVLVRWMKPLPKGWTVAVSAETPSSQPDTDNRFTKKTSEWMPDFAAFLQYDWGHTDHVRLAGIIRTLSYRNLLQGKNRNLAGWGLQLSTLFHPHRSITVYGTLNGGKGIASLGGDLQIGNYDLVPVPGNTGVMYAPASIGWNIGVQYNFTPAIFISANYSNTRYMPRRGTQPEEYKYGQVYAVNAFWNPTPRIQFGAEFDLGVRHNRNGEHRWARRAGLVAQFSF